MEEKKLSLGTRLGFGVCDIGGNLYFSLISFYLIHYLTDSVGLSAFLAGLAVWIGKIWDAVTDPAVGILSDRTHSRWGRRRPWMFVGAFLLVAAMVLMFTNPHLSTQHQLFIWAAVCFVFLSTAYTLVNIPYGALTPELTRDYHEQTVLNGFRMSFAVIGTLLGAVAAGPIVAIFNNKDIGYTMMGLILGGVMLVATLITVLVVKEKMGGLPKESVPNLRSYLSVFRNRPFVLLLVPWSLHITGITIVSGTFLYFFEYIYHNRNMGTVGLGIMLITVFVSIPVWVALSKKIGKKMCYNIGMLIVAGTILIFFFIGHLVSVYISFIFLFVLGFGLATQYVMPMAMIPDTVEYDYRQHGIRREGIYYGIWTFLSKVGQALAALLIGSLLALFGYVAQVEQTAQAKLGIRLLLGPVPVFFFVAGVIVLFFYPLTEEKYNRMKKDI